jgi:hypothetical protein
LSFTLERLERILRIPGVTFRHDVDVSPSAALKMAELEHRLGVRATFYVMRGNPFYDDENAMNLEDALDELGHNVGAHVDERTTHLASLAGRISFHCPTDAVLWRDFPHFQNAYAARWQHRYLADSRGRFAHGTPEELAGPGWQVNLHSERWFDPHAVDSVDPDVYAAFFHEPMALA